MARCGCGSSGCSCVVKGGGGVTVTGAGSVANPYTISSDINLVVVDSPSLDLTLTGDGSDASPFTLTGSLAAILDALTDVDVAAATTGQVLAKQSDGIWRGAAPSSATPGAINLLASSGLQGDGSSGNALGVKLAPSSGLVLSGSGLAVAGSGAWSTYVPAWTASTTNPSLGNGTIEGYYSQAGKTVDVDIELTTGTTTTRGVGYSKFSLPVPCATNRRFVFAVNVVQAGVTEYSGTAVTFGGLIHHVSISTSTAAHYFDHATPASFAAGSIINISGRYEAA